MSQPPRCQLLWRRRGKIFFKLSCVAVAFVASIQFYQLFNVTTKQNDLLPNDAPTIVSDDKAQARAWERKSGAQLSSSKVSAESNQNDLTMTLDNLDEKEKQISFLGVNPNSTVAEDIVRIVHDPHQRQIHIHLKLESRYCKRPQLVGRLSGPSVTKLSWENEIRKKQFQGEEVEVLAGTYRVPQAGKYFLEIIVIFCEELPFETYNGKVCIENPGFNRLTGEGVFIEGEPNKGVSNSNVVGYWYNTQEEEFKHVPLYTRYQPQHCTSDEEKETIRCGMPTNLTRFDVYDFQFIDKNISPEIPSHVRFIAHQSNVYRSPKHDRVMGRRIEEGHKICVVGFSHAEVLLENLTPILSTAGVKTDWVQVRFARDFNKDHVRHLVSQQCTKVVIGLGQWDAGWPQGFTTFPRYEQSLVKAVTHLQEELQMLNETDKKMDVYFMSTHYNPIGDKIGACPARDWRNPIVIDMYNEITERVCQKFKIPFIDTRDIMGPLYDRAGDFCHYRDISSVYESLYIVDKVFERKTEHKRNDERTEPPKPDEQCAFCKGGIPTPDMVVPQTGGNTCSSIKLLTVKEYNWTDTCKIMQKEESVCCPEPEQSNLLALKAPAGKKRETKSRDGIDYSSILRLRTTQGAIQEQETMPLHPLAPDEKASSLQPDIKEIERESPADENHFAHLELKWDERRRYRQATMFRSGRESFDLYEPEATCFDEERFGSDIRYRAYGDGPKFICGVDFIAKKAATAGGHHHGRKKNCLVYSVGSNNQVGFEKAMHKFLNGCEIHTFDPTLSKPFIGGKYAAFHPWGLGEDGITSTVRGKTWVGKSFQTVMRELGHTNRTIDILKIDCEGCEYQVMPPLFELISAGKAKVDQILIELHLKGKEGELLKEFFSGADKAKMRIFHKERNGWGCSGKLCAEYALASETFLRKANNFAIYPDKWTEPPKPDEQCAFCKGGIPTPDMVVPQTGGNTCRSIQLLTVKEFNWTDTCKIMQKEESVCCPEPEQSNHLALKAPADNARSEEGVIVDIAAMRGGNTTVMLNATSN